MPGAGVLAQGLEPWSRGAVPAGQWGVPLGGSGSQLGRGWARSGQEAGHVQAPHLRSAAAALFMFWSTTRGVEVGCLQMGAASHASVQTHRPAHSTKCQHAWMLLYVVGTEQSGVGCSLRAQSSALAGLLDLPNIACCAQCWQTSSLWCEACLKCS